MGFLLVAESEKQAMMGKTGLVTTGIFHIIDDRLSRYSYVCPDGVTNSNLQPKTEISAMWTAPSVLIASCITFRATVVERPHVWYMDDNQLTKTLCPQMPDYAKPTTTSTTNPPILVGEIPSSVQELMAMKEKQKALEMEVQAKRRRDQFQEQRKLQISSDVSSGFRSETRASSSDSFSSPDKCCACDDAKYEVSIKSHTDN